MVAGSAMHLGFGGNPHLMLPLDCLPVTVHIPHAPKGLFV